MKELKVPTHQAEQLAAEVMNYSFFSRSSALPMELITCPRTLDHKKAPA